MLSHQVELLQALADTLHVDLRLGTNGKVKGSSQSTLHFPSRKRSGKEYSMI